MGQRLHGAYKIQALKNFHDLVDFYVDPLFRGEPMVQFGCGVCGLSTCDCQDTFGMWKGACDAGFPYLGIRQQGWPLGYLNMFAFCFPY